MKVRMKLSVDKSRIEQTTLPIYVIALLHSSPGHHPKVYAQNDTEGSALQCFCLSCNLFFFLLIAAQEKASSTGTLFKIASLRA